MIGVVHRAAGNPLAESAPIIVQGSVVPQGHPLGDEVTHQSTENMVTRFRRLERWVSVTGMCSSLTYLVIAVVYLWFSREVPEECDSRLAGAFLGLSLINGAMACIMACYVSVAQRMLSAMAHAARADKYSLEGRDEAASSEESDYEDEVRQASNLIVYPTCCYFLTLNALILCWVFGIYQASHSDQKLCNGMPFIFWVLLVMNAINLFMSGKSGSAVYSSPSGRVLE